MHWCEPTTRNAPARVASSCLMVVVIICWPSLPAIGQLQGVAIESGQATPGVGGGPTGAASSTAGSGNPQAAAQPVAPVVVVQAPAPAAVPSGGPGTWSVISLLGAGAALLLTIYNFFGGQSIKDIRAEFEKKKNDFEKEVDDVKKDFADYRDEFRSARQDLRTRFDEIRSDFAQLVERHNGEIKRLADKNEEQDKLQRKLEAALDSLSADRALRYLKTHDYLDQSTAQSLYRKAESYLTKVIENEAITDTFQLFHSYALLGFVHKRLSNCDLALQYAMKALEIRDDPVVLYNAACYSALCLKEDEAIALLEKSFKRVPRWAMEAYDDIDLRSLRTDGRLKQLVDRYSANCGKESGRTPPSAPFQG
jgi:uncharacterized membrane-anchored protein YhcB (DUF1043 family)